MLDIFPKIVKYVSEFKSICQTFEEKMSAKDSPPRPENPGVLPDINHMI